ncbi:glycosyltransferase [Bradyrhizobium sp.]|uniref:glycosyltransferase n=1 Tax=Bradyrhizobium sp. TaxID=376 RepID=UPI001D566996|nr:glycosyltransferase [Bradyrhizobium sp.]MBI5321078.1 glycosyltransferase [Bradyrhizobium sp.]
MDILFGPGADTDTPIMPCAVVTLTEAGDGRYCVDETEDRERSTRLGLDRPEALIHISEVVASRLAGRITAGIALHAAAVAWGGRSVLIPGQSGAGKSSLAAWLFDKGFDYLTDELVVLAADGAIQGLGRALMLKPDADKIVGGFSRVAPLRRLQAGANLIVRPQDDAAQASPCLCGLIVFPSFSPGAQIAIQPITAAQACIRLMGCNVNARNLADGGFAILSDLARRVPALELRYGSFDQLEGVVDVLARLLLEGGIDGSQARRMMSAFARPAETLSAASAPRFEVPAATPRRGPVRLTVGMATYDDYDGVYFSIQALRIYHPEILDDIEFVVIDNHPDGPCASSLKALEGAIPNYRYVPEMSKSGTSVRTRIFEEASGEFVLCMDSHVFIVPGGMRKLLDHFAENPSTNDLLQGPLVYDDLGRLATHFKPEWRAGMFGTWDDNGLAADPDAPPFEIPMQGLGVFACRRTAWPGFNAAFRGFGGEEGYIHEKFRQRGGRTLCLPFLRWIHRFGRPMGVPYRNTYEDRVWNYLVGLHELGLPTDAMEAHFRELIGEKNAVEMIDRFKLEMEELGI